VVRCRRKPMIPNHAITVGTYQPPESLLVRELLHRAWPENNSPQCRLTHARVQGREVNVREH